MISGSHSTANYTPVDPEAGNHSLNDPTPSSNFFFNTEPIAKPTTITGKTIRQKVNKYYEQKLIFIRNSGPFRNG